MKKFLSLSVISALIVCTLVSCNRKEAINSQTSSDISSQQESSSSIASSSQVSGSTDLQKLMTEMNVAPGQEDILAKLDLTDKLEACKIKPKDLANCNPKLPQDLKNKVIAWNKAPKYYATDVTPSGRVRVSAPSLIPYDQITVENAHLAFPDVGQLEGVGAMPYSGIPTYENHRGDKVSRETFNNVVLATIQINKNGAPASAVTDMRTTAEVAADDKKADEYAARQKKAWDEVCKDTAKNK